MNEEFLIQIRADITQFQQALRTVSAAMGQMSNTINTAFGSTAGSVSRASSAVKGLGAATKDAQVILDQYGQVAVNVGQKVVSQKRQEQQEIRNTQAQLRNLNAMWKEANAQNVAAWNSIQKTWDGFDKQQQKLASMPTFFDKMVATMGRQLFLWGSWSIAIGAAMEAMQALKNAYKEVSEFQVQSTLFGAYQKSQKNAGLPVDATTSADLFRNATALAVKYGDSINDVVQDLSLWYKRTGDLEAASYLTSQALEFQLATGTQLEDTYRTLTALSGQLTGVQMSDADKSKFSLAKTQEALEMITAAAITTGAGLHQLQTNGLDGTKNSADILIQSIEKDGAALRSMGLDLSQIIALNSTLIQSFGNTGAGAEDAAEKIGRLTGGLAKLSDPSVVTKLSKVGIDVSQLNSTKDVLDQLSTIWEKLTTAQQHDLSVTLAGTRQYEAFQVIMENLGRSEKVRAEILKNMGIEEYTAAQMSDTLKVQVAKLNAEWEAFEIAIGELVLPALTSMVSYITSSVIPVLGQLLETLNTVGRLFQDVQKNDWGAAFGRDFRQATNFMLSGTAETGPFTPNLPGPNYQFVLPQGEYNKKSGRYEGKWGYIDPSTDTVHINPGYIQNDSPFKNKQLPGSDQNFGQDFSLSDFAAAATRHGFVNLPVQHMASLGTAQDVIAGNTPYITAVSNINKDLADRLSKINQRTRDILAGVNSGQTGPSQGPLSMPGTGKAAKLPSDLAETTGALDVLNLKYADHIQTLKDAGMADESLINILQRKAELNKYDATSVAEANLAHTKKIENDKAELAVQQKLLDGYEAIYRADAAKLAKDKVGSKPWIVDAQATNDAHQKVSQVRQEMQGLTDDIQTNTAAIQDNDQHMTDANQRHIQQLQEMQNKIKAFGDEWVRLHTTLGQATAEVTTKGMDALISIIGGNGEGQTKLSTTLLKDTLEYLKTLQEINKEQQDAAEKAKEYEADLRKQGIDPKTDPDYQTWVNRTNAALEAQRAAAAYAKEQADYQAYVKSIQDTPLYRATDAAFNELGSSISQDLVNSIFGVDKAHEAIDFISSEINALQSQKTMMQSIYDTQKTHTYQQEFAHKEYMLNVEQEIQQMERRKKAEQDALGHQSVLKRFGETFVKSLTDDFLKQMQTKAMQEIFHIKPDKSLQDVSKQMKDSLTDGNPSMKTNVDTMKAVLIDDPNSFSNSVQKLVQALQGGASGNPLVGTGLGIGIGGNGSLLGSNILGAAATGTAVASGTDIYSGINMPVIPGVGGPGSVTMGYPNSGASASKGPSFLQKGYGAISAGLAGAAIASQGGLGNAVMGGLAGGLGALAATGNPFIAAGIGLIDFVSGGLHKDNPAAMPDKYDTKNYMTIIGELQGHGGANGQHFNPGSDPVMKALGGKSMLSYIQDWIKKNLNSSDADTKALAQNLLPIFGDSGSGQLSFEHDIANIGVIGGSLKGNYYDVYNQAEQAVQQIQSIAGQQNTMPLVGFNQFGGGTGFFPYSWNTPGYDIYSDQNNPVASNYPPSGGGGGGTGGGGGSRPTPRPRPTPPGKQPIGGGPGGGGGGGGGGGRGMMSAPFIVAPPVVNVYVASPAVNLDGRAIARSTQAYSDRATLQGYQRIT